MGALPEFEVAARDERWMRRCLELAATTPPDDVPVAAVVVDADGRELAAATNRRETDADPLAHAEVLALREAARTHADGWRLTGCTLYVTLEPCTMCAGAALSARVGTVVFGAFEPKTGACGSLLDAVREPRHAHRMGVRGGVRERDCAAVMKDFFVARRSTGPDAGAPEFG